MPNGAELGRERLRPARHRAADRVRHAEIADRFFHRGRDHVDDAAVTGRAHAGQQRLHEDLRAIRCWLNAMRGIVERRRVRRTAGRTAGVVDEDMHRRARSPSLRLSRAARRVRSCRRRSVACVCAACARGSAANARSSASRERASSVTSAPSCASSIAAAWPMPCEPPQTSACFPVRSRFMDVASSSGRDQCRDGRFAIMSGSSSSSLSPRGGSMSSRSKPSTAASSSSRPSNARNSASSRRHARLRLVVVAQRAAVAVEHFGDAGRGDGQPRPYQRVADRGDPPLRFAHRVPPMMASSCEIAQLANPGDDRPCADRARKREHVEIRVARCCASVRRDTSRVRAARRARCRPPCATLDGDRAGVQPRASRQSRRR